MRLETPRLAAYLCPFVLVGSAVLWGPRTATADLADYDETDCLVAYDVSILTGSHDSFDPSPDHVNPVDTESPEQFVIQPSAEPIVIAARESMDLTASNDSLPIGFEFALRPGGDLLAKFAAVNHGTGHSAGSDVVTLLLLLMGLAAVMCILGNRFGGRLQS